MRILKLIFRQAPGPMVLAILIGAVSGAASTALIAVIHQAIATWNAPPAGLGGRFLALCGARLVAGFLAQWLLVRLAQDVALDLRVRLSRQILAAPLRHLEEVGAARLQTVLTTDISMVVQTLVAIPVLTINLTIAISCLIYLGWLSWPTLLAFTVFSIVGLGIYQLAIARGYHFLNLNRRQQNWLYGGFRALVEGIKELKLHALRRRDFLDRRLDTTARALRSSAVRAETIFSFAAAFGQMMFVIFVGLLIFWLPRFDLYDTALAASIAMVTLFAMGPFENVVTAMPELSRSLVGLQSIESLGLSLARHGIDAGTPEAEVPAWRRLELVGICHAYHRENEDHSFELGPLDVAVEAGEIVFITGGNGSGKTTLAKLITGLYVPERGELRLDGVAIDDANRETYRQLFSTVFSDFYLFQQLHGLDPGAIERDAPGYLAKLQLDKKVTIRAGKLSATELSQGQKKRLALLTAYLEDRPIYLFDEWAADQDPVFKEVFYRALLPELHARGKTVFVISHDDRYYDIADRLLILDAGQLRRPQPAAVAGVGGAATERTS